MSMWQYTPAWLLAPEKENNMNEQYQAEVQPTDGQKPAIPEIVSPATSPEDLVFVQTPEEIGEETDETVVGQ